MRCTFILETGEVLTVALNDVAALTNETRELPPDASGFRRHEVVRRKVILRNGRELYYRRVQLA